MTESARTFFYLLLLTTNLVACGFREPENVQTIPSQKLAADGSAQVMLFSGTGEWSAEVNSLRQTLFSNDVTYRSVTAAQLNDMSAEQMALHKLLILPGGDSDIISATLLTHTGANLRKAVQEYGLNYLGFCAGVWLAVAPRPEEGHDPEYGLGIINGSVLNKKPKVKILGRDKLGLEFAMPLITLPDGSNRLFLWYGGPVTPNISGGVIARYSNGDPAISQIWSGRGFVTLSGVHPTANKSILRSIRIFEEAAIAPKFTWELIESTMNQRPLLAFGELQ